MKLPTSVIARFSGIVTYADDTHQQFAGSLDADGNLSLNYQPESEAALYQVQTQKSWLQDMLVQLSGELDLDPSSPGITKTVTGLVSELSGRVSYDDGSCGDFIVQYNTQIGAFVPTGGDIINWTNAVAASTTLARLTSLFTIIAGQATLAASPSPSLLSPSPSLLSPSPSMLSPSPSAASPSPSISAFSPSPSAASPSPSAASPSISPSP